MVAYARAHVLNNAVFTIDEDDYANQVTKVRLVPDTPTQTLRTLVPDGQITDTDSATWTVELSGVQDNGATSLGAALRAAANSGTSVEAVLQPKAGTGQDVATFTFRPAQIEFGGEQGNFRTFDATFGVEGQPVFTQSA
jgi:tail tube protein